jgi:tRNA A37 threonylcarbamoyladenosine dehydratase
MTNDIDEVNTQCHLPEHFYSKDDLDKMFQNKKIYIYGAGNDGRGVFHALKRNGYKVEAFLDRSKILTGGGGDIIMFPFFILIPC